MALGPTLSEKSQISRCPVLLCLKGIGRPEETASLEVAAGMLLARAEAEAPGVGGAPMNEQDKLKRALMLALLDKQVRAPHINLFPHDVSCDCSYC